ncbi:MAG: TetR family transcriptional regulator [Leptothrix sp. (in: Bacteria)]|nr:TetR family transcriptional regulator [Leptothrix sp. (in: b-proteobacteria)]
MSYPSKLSKESILQVAMAYIEAHGLAELSMRFLAIELGVTPNALYRYFSSKADLEYAMADEAGRLLLAAMTKAAARKNPLEAIRAVVQAYLKFARSHPELYAVKMQFFTINGQEPSSHTEVWQFVTQLAAAVPTRWEPKDLAVSLWAFLHGMVDLDRKGMLEGEKPERFIEVGLEVILAGMLTGVTAPA